MSSGSNFVFNLIAFVFAVLTIATLVFVIAIAADAVEPPFLAPEPTLVPPTSVLDAGITPTRPVLPTFTPSNTPEPTNTPLPTDTPEPSATPTATITPTGTRTQVPTRTFTPTMTQTSDAPTATPSFTPSPPGPAPTATNTESPYPFMLQPGTPTLRNNFANAQGCNWQGFGGQVIDQNGDPVIGVQVRISSAASGDMFTLSGTNSAYGPSGWEMAVGTEAVPGTYRVQLWVANQGELSPSVEITFPGSCDQNLALVNFVRTR